MVINNMRFDFTLIANFISVIIELLLIICIVFFTDRLFGEVFSKGAAVSRIRRLFKETEKNKNMLSMIVSHIDTMLSVVLKTPPRAFTFLMLCIGLFFLIFISILNLVGIVAALTLASAFSIMPYLYMRVKMENIRRRSSFEGERFICALMSAYCMSGCNIMDAIESILLSDINISVTRRLLEKLLTSVRSTGDSHKLREHLNEFSYGIGTGWSKMLSYHLYVAFDKGLDITLALEDISMQLREAGELFEERRRINSESSKMVLFLIPILYIGSSLMCIFVLGKGIFNFFHTQFITREGFLIVSAIVILFIINYCLLQFFVNKKLDF